MSRVRARVLGTVQGVGFRPYVHRLAGELGLAGWVFNDAHGVLLEVEGTGHALDVFLARLVSEAPPLARVARVEVSRVRPLDESGFRIRRSPAGTPADTPITPDAATCPECLAELFDPTDRRHRYPFINCTNCGPRFTIVRGVPYDRRSTTMVDFPMCDACLAEYTDVSDRRFHAQPNACRVCGPALRLVGPDGRLAGRPGADPVHAAAAALRAGAIVAIKGIGGFHLACRADDETVVGTLRSRKHRPAKPFAVMVAGLSQAAMIVQLGAEERALLGGPERPIVLARRRPGARIAPSVAPGVSELGVMLADSPVQHLLLADVQTTLVMTSANRANEPIAYEDVDALARLDGIADLLLVHDRPIATRTDDSVLRAVAVAVPDGRATMFLRRSRGYVPTALSLPEPARRPILACGGELKNTFCVARGPSAWVSHHIGDLTNAETLGAFRAGIEHFQRLFSVAPQVVAHDLHPEYLSTKFAHELARRHELTEAAEVELVAVQHHHAHLAACLAEHGETGPAVGAIFDGTGYGDDGTVWGGELLVGDLGGFRRAGALAPVAMPGGERAIAEPWRMACAWLCCPEPTAVPVALCDTIEPERWALVGELARSGLASPPTTSMGRLFDAAAALCGLHPTVTYEGQAAIALEAACDPAEHGAYPIMLSHDGTSLVMDPASALGQLLADVTAGVSVGRVAARFHAGIAAATVSACVTLAADAATELVVLAGGVFQNRRLLEATAAGLHAAGLSVLIPEQLPPGDGAISYGQAAVAAYRLATAAEQPGAEPSGAERPGAERPGAERPGAGQPAVRSSGR